MAVRAEPIEIQKYLVRHGLKLILPRIDKDLHGIELRLVPVLMHKIDKNIATLLKQVEIKHSHISSNIKIREIDSFDNIDKIITLGSELTLRKLIMDVRAKYGEIFSVDITHN